MLSKEILLRHKRAAELELEGLNKLMEAAAMVSDQATAALSVVGDPMPVAPVNEQVVLMLPEDVKNASISILERVASALANSEDEESLRTALELGEISKDLEKNAFVYEKDMADPEPELDKYFGDSVIEAPPSMRKDLFNTDVTHEVARYVDEEMPYQKVNTGK